MFHNLTIPSRVLRLVQTINTKQLDPELRTVRVLWIEEEDGSPQLHDFERLAEAVLPFTRKEAAAIEADKPVGRVILSTRPARPLPEPCRIVAGMRPAASQCRGTRRTLRTRGRFR